MEPSLWRKRWKLSILCRLPLLELCHENPLPQIDDTLDSLAQSQYFTTLDLASGYWQVRVDPASQEKTAFAMHFGLHEFRVAYAILLRHSKD